MNAMHVRYLAVTRKLGKTKTEVQLPQNYFCVLTGMVMEQPVKRQNGHIVDASALCKTENGFTKADDLKANIEKEISALERLASFPEDPQGAAHMTIFDSQSDFTFFKNKIKNGFKHSIGDPDTGKMRDLLLESFYDLQAAYLQREGHIAYVNETKQNSKSHLSKKQKKLLETTWQQVATSLWEEIETEIRPKLQALLNVALNKQFLTGTKRQEGKAVAALFNSDNEDLSELFLKVQGAFSDIASARSLSRQVSDLPGYDYMRGIREVLSADIEMQHTILQQIEAVKALQSAPASVAVTLKLLAHQNTLQNIFVGCEVNFLGKGNTLNLVFTQLQSGFKFILRTVDIYEDDIQVGSSPIDVRLFHYNLTKHKKCDQSKNCFVKQYYFNEIPKRDAEGRDIYYLAGGKKYFEIIEFIPGGNLEESYARFRADENVSNTMLTQRAFKDISVLGQLFKELHHNHIGYFDFKPQNLFYDPLNHDKFKLSDLKGLALLLLPHETKQDCYKLSGIEKTASYTDNRILIAQYNPKLDLLIGLIASLYHMIGGEPPGCKLNGLLLFNWDLAVKGAKIFQTPLPTLAQGKSETLAAFLSRHYFADTPDLNKFLGELGSYYLLMQKNTPSHAENDCETHDISNCSIQSHG